MRHRALAICVLTARAWSACLAQGGTESAATSLEQERQAGAAFFARFCHEYGLSGNARYRDVVDAALRRLGVAADSRPELEWRAAVLRHNPKSPLARNASAWPGGYILTDESFMRLIEEEAGGKPERMEALVSGVLAHEMGHVLRRDTDLLVHLYFQSADPEPERLTNALASFRASRRASAAEQRSREERADHDGAFLLLRAGYRIGDMIAVFRRMARDGVGDMFFTGELDHAKPADRIAYLLRIEAEVVEDQTRFDEAVMLLRLGSRGPPLEGAIRSLERVSSHFPDTLAVRHALATAYHGDYLASLPVAGQRSRPAFGFYQFDAVRDTQADAPHTESLQKALNAYQEILRRGEKIGYKGLGPTVGAYALALLQSARIDEALRWARRATELAPDSWPAWNTLGNVLQARGTPAEAVDAYSRALAAACERYQLDRVLRDMYGGSDHAAAALVAQRIGLMEFAPVYFNLASAFGDAGRRREAAGLCRLCVALDPDSEWGVQARARLAALGVAPVVPRVTGLGGIEVADTRSTVEKTWGRPEAQGKLADGTRLLKYLDRGIHVLLNKRETVAGILALPGFHGEIGAPGVVIGASPEQIEKAFGPPITRSPSDNGVEAWDYPAYGVLFVMGAKGVARAVIYGRPDVAVSLPTAATGREDAGGFLVALGDTRARVRRKLGNPDRVSAEGAWVYAARGVRVRFTNDDRADLVVVSRPCSDAVGGIRIGEPAARIGAELGQAQMTTNLDDTATYAFPARGVAYVVQDGQVTAMVLSLPRS